MAKALPNLIRCPQCGSTARYLTPDQAGDDDGFHYVCCNNATHRGDFKCAKEPVWAKTKGEAVREWNRASKPAADPGP